MYSVPLAYLDNIHSKTVGKGLSRLKLVLESLENADLTITMEKCRFLKRKIDYLDFEISIDGIKPGHKKILAVRNFLILENVRTVRGYIGLSVISVDL